MNKNMIVTETTFYTQLTGLYCSYSSTHNICSNLYANIKNNINIFTNYNLLLMKFINSLNKNYYNGGACVSMNACTELFEILINIADIESLDNQTFKNMCLNLKFTEYLILHIIKMKKISSELISKIIFSQNKIMIEKILLNNDLELNFTSEHIEILCTNNTYYIKSQMTIYNGSNKQVNQILIEDSSKNTSKLFTEKLINELINKKIKVSKASIILAILYNFNLPLIKTLLSHGPTLCEDYLIAACFSLNKDIIDFLLDNKLEPTSKCMKAIFKTNIYDELGFSENELKVDNMIKEKPYNTSDIKTINKYSKILETILNYNYKLDYDDVLNATRYFVQINNIKNYDIKLDSKFLEVCYDVGFHPTYHHDIKPDITCLQKECNKYGNLSNIKNLVNKYNIIPDTLCMQNACKFKSNTQTIKFLHEKGAPVDHNAIKNIIYTNGNSSLIFLIDEYIKTIEEKKEVIKDVAKDVAKDVVKEGKTKNNKNIVLTSDNEEETDKPVKTKKIIIKKTKKNDIIENKENKAIIKNSNKTVKDNTDINLDDYKLVKIKITNKDEISISENLSQFFNLEKNVKLKLLSFKKILFNYFNNNKLIKKDSFDIELSNELCKAIGFDTIKYGNIMNLKDIDIFCLYILDINNISNNTTSLKICI